MSRPLILFAPGAGAPSSHPWMRAWAERLARLGDVEVFDYAYVRENRRRPDRLPELIAAHRRALDEARVHRSEHGPVILAGKSMGGRIGCHVALEEKVDALVCFGYPLCGGGDPTKLRDRVLRELRTPVLFVQGTRDPLCPLDLLERVRSEMQTDSSLYVVEGGDHSLQVRKRELRDRGVSDEEVNAEILDAIAAFLAQLGVAKLETCERSRH